MAQLYRQRHWGTGMVLGGNLAIFPGPIGRSNYICINLTDACLTCFWKILEDGTLWPSRQCSSLPLSLYRQRKRKHHSQPKSPFLQFKYFTCCELSDGSGEWCIRTTVQWSFIEQLETAILSYLQPKMSPCELLTKYLSLVTVSLLNFMCFVMGNLQNATHKRYSGKFIKLLNQQMFLA